MSQSRRLSRDSLKDVIDKGIHYTHSFRTDAGIGMNLLQYFINVHRVTLLPLSLLFFLSLFEIFFWALPVFTAALPRALGATALELTHPHPTNKNTLIYKSLLLSLS
jgi:hypothetical protein